MVPAKFGSKKFEVSTKKIYTPNGTALSEELNFEETEVSGKKPTVNIKGIKLKALSFDLKLDSRFVTVQSELSFWENTLLSKTSQFFVLGKYTLGKFFLTKYDIKDYTINKNGEYTGAVISLTFTEDGKYANTPKTTTTTTKKASTVKNSTKTTAVKVRKGSTIKPKSGVRWYYTADGAIKKTGKSGKAYQKNMKVTHTYSKSGKIVCVNPGGLGWLKVEDVTVVKY